MDHGSFWLFSPYMTESCSHSAVFRQAILHPAARVRQPYPLLPIIPNKEEASREWKERNRKRKREKETKQVPREREENQSKGTL